MARASNYHSFRGENRARLRRITIYWTVVVVVVVVWTIFSNTLLSFVAQFASCVELCGFRRAPKAALCGFSIRLVATRNSFAAAAHKSQAQMFRSKRRLLARHTFSNIRRSSSLGILCARDLRRAECCATARCSRAACGHCAQKQCNAVLISLVVKN